MKKSNSVLQANGMHVLLADDNPDSKSRIKFLLEQLGFNVTTVDSGAGCISEVKRALTNATPYSIIFIDMKLPDITGAGVARILRKERIRTPIVAITAEPSLAVKHESVYAGCDGFLAKQSVSDTIEHALSRFLI